MNKMKIKNVKLISLSDWDKLVSTTYKRPYNLQQQNGCQEKGTFELTIPSDFTEDDYMNDEIQEEINGEIMGVKFEKWLERDPKAPVDGRTDYGIELWWHRNFYPDVYTVANDLYKKGLLDAGEYVIKIDW